jgi:hypothetical protein
MFQSWPAAPRGAVDARAGLDLAGIFMAPCPVNSGVFNTTAKPLSEQFLLISKRETDSTDAEFPLV